MVEGLTQGLGGEERVGGGGREVEVVDDGRLIICHPSGAPAADFRYSMDTLFS